MFRIISLVILIFIFTNCQTTNKKVKIVTDDIDNFWIAYDKIISTKDSVLQYKYLDSLYFKKGTPGLEAIIQLRNYTAKDYIDAINDYPKFWGSIKKNTQQAKGIGVEIDKEVKKFRDLYPDLKTAQIYFTIGAFRTNGTTRDSLVLIGSELAMANKYTISSEFPEGERASRKIFFESNPIDHLVLLNMHELVHTQQNEMVQNILSQVIYEGVAEFVSVKIMGVPSSVPAIEYGKKNSDKLRKGFEEEMFYVANRHNWLWSDAKNDFGIRDLGYYIGYRISELYYEKSADKKEAIKKLIELDYKNETEIENFVNDTGFFTDKLEVLYKKFDKKRPTVINLKPFANNSKVVNPKTEKIIIEFSEPLNGVNTGIDYGPLGEDFFPKISRTERIWSKDHKRWSIGVKLEPNRHYQFLIDNNFRTQDRRPLKPFLIDFVTGTK